MSTITQKQLDLFKSLHPGHSEIHALTLEKVQKNTHGKTVNWNSIQFAKQPAAVTTASPATPCQMAVGWVVFDVVSLAVGAVGLRSSVSSSTIEAMANAAAPVLSKIEITVAKMAAQGATTTDIAWGVFEILKTIFTGGSLGAVFSAFTASLSWWDMILYGVTGTATIIAALATDGLAFAAEMVILLASAGWVVSDAVKASTACSLPAASPGNYPLPVGGTDPLPFEPVVAVMTTTGNFLTVVANGGLGGGNVAIQTDRRAVGPWEKFTIQPINQQNQSFAIKTVNGNYVTAVNGGGMGGPNDASCPIHTDATVVGPWEKLIFEQMTDGTYAICTTTGFYLTAVNGGGVGEPQNLKPIHTDATALGPWETFVSVPQ